MENENKKSVRYYMRALHKDIGFFLIGLTLIYAISGIVLVYRDTDFLKQETVVNVNVKPNTDPSELQKALHAREFKILNAEGDVIKFRIGKSSEGTYNKSTGEVVYTSKELPQWMTKLTDLHKSASQSIKHFIAVIFAVLLVFLSVSSFWMFKSNTKQLRRGFYFAGGGVLFSIIIIMI